MQGIILTTLAKDFNVTNNSLYPLVPILIANTETQVMFKESVKNKYTITYGSWCTERKITTDGKELQVDIGSAQHINIPKYRTASFQTVDRIGAHNKNNNITFFDNVRVKKKFCEVDGYRLYISKGCCSHKFS